MSEAAGTAHVDAFARDNLPPPELWPVLDLSGLPELSYPPRLNCAAELLDRNALGEHADRPAIRFGRQVTTYRQLLERVNRIANVLVDDLGVVPGNRVLLRGTNHPTMVACWLATLKVGAICVTTMPLLRARELSYIFDKARVNLALCDGRLTEDLYGAIGRGENKPRVACFNSVGPSTGSRDRADLDALAARKSAGFANVETAADDVALIAFTSGTTGQPKGAMHFHRDVLAICDTFPKYLLRPEASDVFCGTPPLAFTYGLGGLLTFPFRVGASTALLEQPSPEGLLELIREQRCTICFTSPVMYRALLPLVDRYDISSLRLCVSAGENLPLPTWEAWHEQTGLKIVDGLGATELLHIFISAVGDRIRPGSTGRVVPGYRARVVDDEMNEVPPGTVGRLAVQGPTGCRYLADPERQKGYVRAGWNLTGDAYRMDEDGYFWYQARTDDMIVSAGYNIAGPEVEAVLLDHPKVLECGVVGSPDPERGTVVKAFVVLRDQAEAGEELVKELQEFVKREIAPYKYPRKIEFVPSLPRTETGKLQRYKLRELELGGPPARGS